MLSDPPTHELKNLRKKICTYSFLKQYLNNGSKTTRTTEEEVNYFIESDSECWKLWNRVRWDAALEKNDIGLQEVREYLGADFEPYKDTSWSIASTWNEIQPQTDEEIADFYRKNRDYILNLVIWHESGDRGISKDYLEKLVEKYHIKSVNDFGCGVGTDGLRFVDLGVEVFFLDFECPSVDFLKFRLKKRQIDDSCTFNDVDQIKKFPSCDMFWAIDVLEHMPNPLEIFDKMDESYRVFAHRSKFNDIAGGRHPCHLNFQPQKLSEALTDRGFQLVSRNPVEIWIKE